MSMTDHQPPLFDTNEAPYEPVAKTGNPVETELAERPPPDPADRDRRADWLLSQIRIMEADRARVEAIFEFEMERLEERRSEIVDQINGQISYRADELKAWHRAEVAGGGKRTVKLPSGTLRATRPGPALVVTNQAALLEWCNGHLPEHVETIERVRLADVKQALKSTADKVAAELKADSDMNQDRATAAVAAPVVPGLQVEVRPTRVSYTTEPPPIP